ncbi:uncharacterized protein TM35_000471270 [Trypanosoma theileri]|uniref:Mucin TcMUCII n=1 Tax=Trypanosoma theileri TaxID=67003 RepID=A0A1X0NHJ1_9TRYP|nr:uncharacterized protein TM35_000471270 [Trypanosoma theileri]ORC84232.1 hypothetical protein TM35_000471270 [Trypanosoma theileri]
MMMMRRVMCVLAVVLCCACGYTMTAAAAGETLELLSATPNMDEFPHIPRVTEPPVDKSKNVLTGEALLTGTVAKNEAGEAVENQESLLGKVHEGVSLISGEERRPGEISTGADPSTSLQSSKGQQSTQEGTQQTQVSASQTRSKNVSGDVDSTQTESPGESAKPTDESNVNDSITAQQPSTAMESTVPSDVNSDNESTVPIDTTATTGSQENGNADSTATTNINSEAPTTTPSPLTDPPISSNIASTMQMKPNVDSSVSPVWMRTAAPLLIVIVLFSVTMY